MRPGDTGIVRKVTVGLVVKPVGLKGELKIKPLTDNPDRYAVGGRLWLSSKDGDLESFTIESVREHGGNLVVKLSGLDSLEEAEGRRGEELYVPESEVPPLPEGEYYEYQVIGLQVYTHDGRLLGTVREIFKAGEKDVYAVRGQGREYLIPVTDDAVREIDVKGGRISLNPLKDYISDDEG